MKIKTNFYILLTLWGWHIIKKYKEVVALINGNKFYCLALQGEAMPGLAISSDLTVSCNCTDIYGYGKIGNLKSQTMDEILSGHKALTLKKRLDRGKLPMINCTQCVNLRMTKIKIDINKYQMPKGILLENTVICNLNCLSRQRKKI